MSPHPEPPAPASAAASASASASSEAQPESPATQAAVPPALRVTFERGVSPSKWSDRWKQQHPQAPLGITVRMKRRGDQLADDTADLLLARVFPGEHPDQHSVLPLHTVRLYQERVALMVHEDHPFADEEVLDVADLEGIPLLPHSEHGPEWPDVTPWADPSTAPRSTEGTIALIAAAGGAVLVPDTLGRHLGLRGVRRILVTGIPGSWIWACWPQERDTPLVQDYVGVLRGRKRGSSRHETERAEAAAQAEAAKKLPKPSRKRPGNTGPKKPKHLKPSVPRKKRRR